jgi:hypothetical protein
MDSQYHCFRRHVLMARQAYISETEPARVAKSILAAAQELVLLSGRIPRNLQWQESRKIFPGRWTGAAPNEPLNLLLQDHVLVKEAEQLASLHEDPWWQQQAYSLIWRLDCFLVQMAGACRSASAALSVGAKPVPAPLLICLH